MSSAVDRGLSSARAEGKRTKSSVSARRAVSSQLREQVIESCPRACSVVWVTVVCVSMVELADEGELITMPLCFRASGALQSGDHVDCKDTPRKTRDNRSFVAGSIDQFAMVIQQMQNAGFVLMIRRRWSLWWESKKEAPARKKKVGGVYVFFLLLCWSPAWRPRAERPTG